MKNLIIVCAGGFGKEALRIAEQMNEKKPTWNIQGFIDDTIPIGTEIYHGYRILGNISDVLPSSNQSYVIGNSNPKSKMELYTLLKSKGCIFATLINPRIYIPPETIIGEGSIISDAWFGSDVVLGKCVHIAGSMVGDATIGDFSTTTGFANIAGGKLGKCVFVGSHAVVLNNVKVGDNARISAGSIVFRNVKHDTIVYGNPARELKI